MPDVLSLEDLLPFRAVLLREDRVDHGDLLRPDGTLDAGVFEACADDAAETVGATQPRDSCSIGPSVGDQESQNTARIRKTPSPDLTLRLSGQHISCSIDLI